MGSSFVYIGESGFWMNDGVLEVWLRLLALHLKEPTKEESFIREIRDRWLLYSRGYFGGCISVHLEEAVSTPEGRAVVVAAIDSLMKALEKTPKLDHDTLNLLGFEAGEFTADLESERFLDVGHAFLALIDGKIRSKIDASEFMPGSWRRRDSRQW